MQTALFYPPYVLRRFPGQSSTCGAVSALDCAPPHFARASPPPCPARPRIPPAMRPRMSPSPPLPSPSPPSPPRPPPARHHAPTHSARGTVTTHRLGFRKRRNASRGHVEG